MSDNIKKVYQSFIKAGFSPNQAKALTAEVGRENAYQSKYIFGHHTDMANSADNLGFFSWQGERKKNLLNKLQQKGLYSNGRISESQESLNTMAEFAKEEMENISSYKKTKEGFLKNPNVSQAEAAELLGRNYLRWDMDGKYIKNVGEHKKRRDKFYSQISGEPYTEQQYSDSNQEEQHQAGYVGMLPNGLPDVYGQPYVAEEKVKEEETAEAPKRTDNANKLGFVADYEELAKQYEQQLQAQQKPILQQEIVEGVQYQPIQQNFQEGGTKKKALKTADKVAEASFIGKMLDFIPGAETVYDIKNIISGLGEGDYKKIGANTVGALLPGVSGKAFEAVAEDWLPETPEIEKKKMKFNNNTSPAKRQEYLKKYGAGYLNNSQFIKEVLNKYQDGGIKTDPQGYWNPDNEGKPVIIPSNRISMKNVDFSVLGIADTGEMKIMMPGFDYFFSGAKKVTEIPLKNE